MQKLTIHSVGDHKLELMFYKNSSIESLTLKDMYSQEIEFKLEPSLAKQLLIFIRKNGGSIFGKKFKIVYETSEACFLANLCPTSPNEDESWYNTRPPNTIVEGTVTLEKVKVIKVGLWFFTFELTNTNINDLAI